MGKKKRNEEFIRHRNDRGEKGKSPQSVEQSPPRGKKKRMGGGARSILIRSEGWTKEVTRGCSKDMDARNKNESDEYPARPSGRVEARVRRQNRSWRRNNNMSRLNEEGTEPSPKEPCTPKLDGKEHKTPPIVSRGKRNHILTQRY